MLSLFLVATSFLLNARSTEGACSSHRPSSNVAFSCSDGLNLGSTCTFRCDRGYELHGGVYLTCEQRESGSHVWSEIEPLCRVKSGYGNCPAISAPANGGMSCNNEFLRGVICSFSCSSGYTLDRTTPSICKMDQTWNDPPPSCKEDVPICTPKLNSPDDGDVSCTDSNRLGSVCSFSCVGDLVLSGQSSVTCIGHSPVTATWNAGPPTCRHTCLPAMHSPTNGSATCTEKNMENSVCSFTCDKGFLISEVNVVVTCVNFKGAWSWDRVAPTCDEIPVRCADLRTAQLSKNTIYDCTNLNNEGSVCSFRCDGGAVLSTDYTASTCSDTAETGLGKWIPEIPKCFFSACKKPSIPNGEVTCAGDVVPGSACGVACSSGFLPSSPTTFTCTKSGTWEGVIPQCNPAPCLPALNVISEGSCVKGNAPGSVCDIVCKSHLQTKKPAKFACSDPATRNGAGFWKGNLTDCIGCGKGLIDLFILIDTSANVKSQDFPKLLEFLSYIVRSLGKRFDTGSSWIGLGIAGSEESTCDPQKGSLSSFQLEIPLRNLLVPALTRKITSIMPTGGCFHLGSALSQSVSHVVKRRRPNFTSVIMTLICGPTFDDFSGAVTMANAAGIEFTVVGFGAARGFNFEDITTKKERIIFVPGPNLFPSASPHVINILAKIDCPKLSRCAGRIPNGQVVCVQRPDKAIPFHEICSANCIKGYALVGNSTALCGDGNGDGAVEMISPLGFCKEIRCRDREPPKDGFVSCDNNNIFPSLCKYFCSPNYFMIGLSEAFCGDPDKNGVGDWSSEIPLCVADLLCSPSLTPPSNGVMKCTKNSSFGSQCQFACEDGYEIVGSGIVNCGNALPDGSVEWTDRPPTCKKCGADSCKLDVMILMDGSGSIRTREFSQMKNWVVEVLEGYKGGIDSGGTRVGLIQYSGEATFMCNSGEVLPKYSVELELAQHTFHEVRTKIIDIGHLKGCTATGDAVRQGIKHFATLGRPGVGQVMIVVTDGKSNDDVVKPAQEARSKSINLIAIGIGEFEQKELQQISGSSNVIGVSSFDELDSSISTVQEEIKNQITHDDSLMASSGTSVHPRNIVKGVRWERTTSLMTLPLFSIHWIKTT